MVSARETEDALREGARAELLGWERLERARFEIAHVARILGDAGIAIMPFKGVEMVLQYGVEPKERPFQDVDVLVAPGRFDEAASRLQAAGYDLGPGATARLARRTESPMLLDLHRRVLPPAMGKLSSTRLFSRGRRDAASNVVHMHPADHWVTTLCQWAKDGFPASRARSVRVDVQALASRVGADELSEAASGAGLRALSWVALDELGAQAGDSPLRGMYQLLEPGKALRIRCSATRHLASARLAQHPEVQYALIRAMQDSIVLGASSAGLSLVRYARDLVTWSGRARAWHGSRPARTRA